MLPGKHADISNIDDNHCFIHTKKFWVNGKPVVHTEGEKTGLMHNLVQLRNDEPKVRAMLDKLHLMGQPSGYVDQVIMSWHLAHQAEQFPLSLAVRDLFTGAYCDKSRLSMSMIQQVSSWIWGKMTPVCQLSDTTATFPLKWFLHKHQILLRQELKNMHEAEQTIPNFKCGYYELLRLVSRSLDELNEFMDGPKQRTLRDSVSNGLLAYRPNPGTGKMESTVEQPRAKALGLKVGNHRMRPEWSENRYKWLDENGKPIGPFEEADKCLLRGEYEPNIENKDPPELEKKDAPEPQKQ